MKDAFDLWWEWAEMSIDDLLTIDEDIHCAVLQLSPKDRHDRDKVNEAVRRYRQNRKIST